MSKFVGAEMGISKVELLDCTIRDGGHLNNWEFTKEEVLDCYKAVSRAGFDYFEIGFLRSGGDTRKYGRWRASALDDIAEVGSYPGCRIAVMVSVETDQMDDLPAAAVTGITLIRLNLRFDYSLKIYETTRLFHKMKEKGYEVSLNLSSADQYDWQKIDLVANRFGSLDFKCIYLADTYGSLTEKTTHEQFCLFRGALDKYDSAIPLAFHPHNHMGNAMSKTQVALNHGIAMLDSTIYGLGKGGGNLSSEAVLLLLCDKIEESLPIMAFSDKHMVKFDSTYRRTKNLYLLSAKLGVHPDKVPQLSGLSLEKAFRELVNSRNLPKCAGV